MKRTAPLAASLALIAATAIGCGDGGSDDKASGGSDEPPTNASSKEFCGAFEDLITELGKLGQDAQPKEAVAILKDAGGNLGDIGTPEDMPEDARSGFEIVLREIDGLDDNATREDINNLGADLSDAENTQMSAYEKYLQETCADQLGQPAPPSEGGQGG